MRSGIRSHSDTYFTSKETVYSFLVRSFTHWRWFHGFDRAILQECTTDEMCVTQGIHYNDVRYSQLQHHDWTPLHPNNEETWRGVGMGVAMALACKEDLSGVDYVSLGMTEELKADHQMQLQTLVAYFYLRGLDFYGVCLFTGALLPRKFHVPLHAKPLIMWKNCCLPLFPN